jgi:uncharacterized Zn finger protein (UPF0148 family)
MVCDYCKSDLFYLKDKDDKTGLYCQSCGRWLKWVSGDEKAKIMSEIEKRKRAITIDGADFEIVKEKLKAYKKKYDSISEEIRFYKQRSTKNKTGGDLQATAMYDKALKLKELSAKIAAYDEVLLTLRLK